MPLRVRGFTFAATATTMTMAIAAGPAGALVVAAPAPSLPSSPPAISVPSLPSVPQAPLPAAPQLPAPSSPQVALPQDPQPPAAQVPQTPSQLPGASPAVQLPSPGLPVASGTSAPGTPAGGSAGGASAGSTGGDPSSTAALAARGAPTSKRGSARGESLAARSAAALRDRRLRTEVSLFRGCLAALSPAERRLLAQRAGIGGPPLSAEQAAAASGMGAAAERKLESRALRDLGRAATGTCAGAAAAAAPGTLVSAVSGVPMLEPTVLLARAVPALESPATLAPARGQVLGVLASSGSGAAATTSGLVPLGVFRPWWASASDGRLPAVIWASLFAVTLMLVGVMTVARSRSRAAVAASLPEIPALPAAAISPLEVEYDWPGRELEELPAFEPAPPEDFRSSPADGEAGHLAPAAGDTWAPAESDPSYFIGPVGEPDADEGPPATTALERRPSAASRPEHPGRRIAALVTTAVGSVIVRALMRRGRR